MTDNFDPYRALDLAYGVTDAEIKSQYRKLIKQYHPDRNSAANAAEKFNKVVLAYKILSDPKKKAEFDRLREQEIFSRYHPKSSFFDGIKSFATRMANDFIDDLTQEMEDEMVDPSLFEISDISSRSTRRGHEITITIPRDVEDIWNQDKDYWIEQACLFLHKELTRKL